MRHIITLLTVLLFVTATGPLAAQTAPPAPPVRGEDVLQRGVTAATNGDLEQAIFDFSLFILLNPTDARGYYLRGITYFNNEDDEEALANYAQALRFSEELPQLRANILTDRSQLYQTQNNPEAALADLNGVIELQPSSEAYLQRGLFQLSASAFEEAVADLDSAIELAPQAQPALFLYRALAKEGLQNQSDAASDYLAWINAINQQPMDEAALESGDTVTLSMSQSVVYRIPFQAKRGEEINMMARNVGGDIDPLLVILAPDGTPLVGNDDVLLGRNPTSVVTGFTAPQSGSYTVLVTHSISGYTGSVEVMLETR
jgi:tetratricopeptide (TPR) repeat protein